MNTAVAPKLVIIETPRLYLRELNPAMVKYLFTACTDDEICAALGLKDEQELAQEKDKFRKGMTTYYHSFKNFIMVDKQTDKAIGRCGYHTWIVSHRRAEVGYVLFDDSYKRQGLMTEALGPVLAYGFEEMGLRRIEALAADYNIPSVRLLQKYGMQLEGVIREHYVVDGVNEDSVLYSIIRPDYDRVKEFWNLIYEVHKPAQE
jgi:[ribosomal protein S5]-alanine N-acetyltransferase